MGDVDSLSKKYMNDNSRFADVFNYLIYGGESVIDPAALSPLDTTEVVIPYGNGAREPEQRYRDVLKLWQVMTDGEAIYAVLGSEIQAKVHYAMPVKDGLYDFMHYAKQVEAAKNSYRSQDGKQKRIRLTREEFLSGFRKDDKLMPVITLVIYLGASEWDGPMSIHEMLSTKNRRLLRFVQDYRIHLISPGRIADEEFLKFKTDLGKVLQYIKYSKDKEKLYELTHRGERFRNVDVDSANLINVVTGSELEFEVEEGQVNMCKAIDEMRKESRQEGILEGRQEGIMEGRQAGILEILSGLVKEGVLTLTDAARRVGLSPDEFQARISGISTEQ